MFEVRPYLICFSLACAMIVIDSQNTQAQEMNLTVQDSVRIAIQNNLSLKESDFDSRAAESELTRVRSGQGITFNVAVVGSQQTYLSQDQISAASYNNYQTQVQIKKMLVPSRELRHTLNLTKRDIGIAALEKENVRRNLIYTTKSLHWKIITLYNLRALQLKRVDRFKKMSEVASAKEKYGLGFRLDTNWAETQLGLAMDGLNETENELELNELQFHQTLQIASAERLHFVDDLPETSQTAEPLLLLVARIKNQKELDIASLHLGKKAEDERFAHRRLFPSFNIAGGYNEIDGRTASIGIDDTWTASVTGSYPIENEIPIFYQKNYFANFLISYDILDGFTARANLRSAQANFQSEQARFQETEAALQQQIEKNHLALQNAINRVRTLEKISTIAEENVKASQLRYNAGRSSLTDFLNIETDGFEAASKLLNARLDLNLAAELVKKDLNMGDYAHE